ncbi:MAG: hypothetical protein KIT09_16445 [Bryobacteraceae bacterium]|nr:hypothetical protein [Bryobacteraceae bacterium]
MQPEDVPGKLMEDQDEDRMDARMNRALLYAAWPCDESCDGNIPRLEADVGAFNILLLGWVTMAISGIVYIVEPQCANRRQPPGISGDTTSVFR